MYLQLIGEIRINVLNHIVYWVHHDVISVEEKGKTPWLPNGILTTSRAYEQEKLRSKNNDGKKEY